MGSPYETCRANATQDKPKAAAPCDGGLRRSGFKQNRIGHLLQGGPPQKRGAENNAHGPSNIMAAGHVKGGSGGLVARPLLHRHVIPRERRTMTTGPTKKRSPQV